MTLLKNGLLNPYKISEITGLHRGYIYDSLERMQEKGVVNVLMQNNKKHYQATSPENLVEILELKLDSLRRILPELNKLSLSEKEETKVGLHKGNKVWSILLKDIMRNAKKGDEVLFIGINEDTVEPLEPIYLKRYFNLMRRVGWKEKAIIKKGMRKISEDNITYRTIEPKLIGDTTQVIYHGKVALFITGNPFYLVIIENKEVAETYTKNFKMLWKMAK